MRQKKEDLRILLSEERDNFNYYKRLKENYNGDTHNSELIRYYFCKRHMNQILYEMYGDNIYRARAEKADSKLAKVVCAVQKFPKPDPNAKEHDRKYD